MASNQFSRFKDQIAALPAASSYTPDQLKTKPFLLDQENDITVYYAPFEYINHDAKIALVGLTPGWTQMEVSFVEARAALQEGAADKDVLRRVKRVAAFSGSMRTNLVSMLNELGLPAALGTSSTSDLFEPHHEDLLHSTSALRYPVFRNGKNYSGSPAVSRIPILKSYTIDLAEELDSIGSALVVPLGKSVEAVLTQLAADGHIDPKRCLVGFPHPSGANVSRASQFESNKDTMTSAIAAWFA